MSRQLMPKSGAMAPYLVMNRDAAVAGVFTVDGEAGSVVLTNKYVQINAYNTRVGAIEQRVSTIEGQIVTINQSISDLNTAVGANTQAINDRARKGANSDITELNSLTKAILISQGGTGSSDLPGARTNLQVNRLTQSKDFTLLTAPDFTRLVVANNKEIQFQDQDGVGFGLPINAGGTGATSATQARANFNVQGVHCVTSTVAGDFNALSSPDDTMNLLIANNGTWGVQSTTGVITPLAVERGGTGATTAADARKNLGLSGFDSTGSEAHMRSPNLPNQYIYTNDLGQWGAYDTTLNNTVPLLVNNGGTGSRNEADARANLGITALGLGSTYPLPSTGGSQVTGFYTIEGLSPQVPPQAAGTGCGVVHIAGSSYGLDIAGVLGGGGRLFSRTYNNSVGQSWREFWSDGNTTVDANGFIKKGSPIVKLKGDGTADLNEEAEGVTVERIGIGVYKIVGVLGFNSDPVWGGVDGGVELPLSFNKLALIWADYKVLPDGSILLYTFHREHIDAPEFARNIIPGVKNGDPIDIPKGRWVDLRVEMPSDSVYNQRLSSTETK